MFLWRPVLADPPLCSFRDLDAVTLDDVADMNEALDLREESARRAALQLSRRPGR